MAAEGGGIVEATLYTDEDIAVFEKRVSVASEEVNELVTDLVADGHDPIAVAAAFVISGAAALSSRFKPDVVLTLIRNAMEKHAARLQ